MKLEAERRLAKADRFLAQAAILPSGDVPEAIVHLTYYAMLPAAVLIERTGRAPKTHGTIIGQFVLLTKDQGDRARSLGRAFNWAEDLRLASDYVTGEVPSLADVTTIHATAREFVAYCRSLL